MNTSRLQSQWCRNAAWLLLALNLTVSACTKASTMDTVHQKFSPERAELAKQMKDVADEHIHMPPLPVNYAPERYINVLPSALRDSLKGKVVLIDIWDYTCVNCIQTLPYIKEWNNRYKDKGLVVIGVHAPEFEFEREPKNLDSAVKQFGLNYPIIADNEYEIWNSLANQYWPAKYLFDKNGILRTQHFGEGEYQEFEAFLQKILLERDSTIDLPELVQPVRETDKPGAVCYRATPETYVGFARNHLGNAKDDEINKPHIFRAPASLTKDILYLDGPWTIKREYAQPAGTAPASLAMDYQAKEANLVIHPLAESGFKIEVTQDGKPLAKEDRGADVIEEGGKTMIVVQQPRMYRITNNADFGRHTLRLTSSSPSFGAYAFTFTTACKH
jgi:thiol-disulfide isomerase/thioredoxin